MGDRTNEHQAQLVEQLTVGFGAMLEQVEELARRNHDLRQQLEQVRQRVHEEVYFLTLMTSLIFTALAMMRQYSSRSGATFVAVIDSIPYQFLSNSFYPFCALLSHFFRS